MKRHILLFALLGIALLCSACGGGGAHTDTDHMLFTFIDCRKLEDAKTCFETKLGVGVTGITKEGDFYEKWYGTSNERQLPPGWVYDSKKKEWVTGSLSPTVWDSCTMEVNFRNNKLFRWTFTGECPPYSRDK